MAAAVVILTVFASIIVDGFVISVLWNWFMTLLGAGAITIPVAIGISTILNLILCDCKTENEVENYWAWAFGRIIVVPGCYLLLGFVAHHFAHV